MEGHLWWDKKNWGYRTYKTKDELHSNYATLMAKLEGLVPRGLAAAVYTQTTDCEGEVNGLMTYDRVPKFDPAWMKEKHAPLYRPAGMIKMTVIAPTAETAKVEWAYTLTEAGRRLGEAGFRRLFMEARTGWLRLEGHAGRADRHRVDRHRRSGCGGRFPQTAAVEGPADAEDPPRRGCDGVSQRGRGGAGQRFHDGLLRPAAGGGCRRSPEEGRERARDPLHARSRAGSIIDAGLADEVRVAE